MSVDGIIGLYVWTSVSWQNCESQEKMPRTPSWINSMENMVQHGSQGIKWVWRLQKANERKLKCH